MTFTAKPDLPDDLVGGTATHPVYRDAAPADEALPCAPVFPSPANLAILRESRERVGKFMRDDEPEDEDGA